MVDDEIQESELRDMQSLKNIDSFSLESSKEFIVGIREIPGTEGFYNAAAWEVDGVTYLLGRNVKEAGGEDEPDVGSLVLLTLGPDGNIASSREIWKPEGGEHLLEDARALLLPDGKIAFGLTAVTREGDRYVPYPAVLITSTEELSKGTLPEPKIIKVMGKGDQTTPLGEEMGSSIGKNVTAIGPNMFAFRPDGTMHQLQVFEYKESGEVSHRQYIDFPDNISWAEWRIGTTMPPVWLNANEAIFPIHGINIVDGRFDYSIGTSRLRKDENGILTVDNISQEPIIHPDLFVGMFDKDGVELHGERRVVYWCGGIPVYNDSGELQYLKGYINVGDKRTVEVTLSVDKLTEGWHSSEQVEINRLVSV